MGSVREYNNWDELRASETAVTALATRRSDREPVVVYAVNLPTGTNVTVEAVARDMRPARPIGGCIEYNNLKYSKDGQRLFLERPTEHVASLYEYAAAASPFLIPYTASEDVQRYRHAFNCSDGISEPYIWRVTRSLLNILGDLHNPYLWPDFRPRSHPLLSPSNVLAGPDDSFLLEGVGLSHILRNPDRLRREWNRTVEWKVRASTHKKEPAILSNTDGIISMLTSLDLQRVMQAEETENAEEIANLELIDDMYSAEDAELREDAAGETRAFTVNTGMYPVTQGLLEVILEPLLYYSMQISRDPSVSYVMQQSDLTESLSSLENLREQDIDSLLRGMQPYHDPDMMKQVPEELTTKFDVFLLGVTLVKLCIRNRCTNSVLNHIISYMRNVDSWQSRLISDVRDATENNVLQPLVSNIMCAGYSWELASFIVACLTPSPALRPTIHELKRLYAELSQPILSNVWYMYSMFRGRAYNMTNTHIFSISNKGVKLVREPTELMKAVKTFDNDSIPACLDNLLVVDTLRGRTALMIAVEEGNMKAIPYLLPEAGVELVKDSFPTQKHSGVQLLNLNSPLHELNSPASKENGFTALSLALKAKNAAAIEVLAPLEVGFAGFTHLMAAVVANDYQAICLYQTDIGKYCEGTTALMLAVLFGRIKCCELLLSELYLDDTEGRSVLAYGASIKNPTPEVAATLSFLAREWIQSSAVSPLIVGVLTAALVAGGTTDAANVRERALQDIKTIAATTMPQQAVDGIEISAIVHTLQLQDFEVMKALLPTHYTSTYQRMNLLELGLVYKSHQALEIISDFLIESGCQMIIPSHSGQGVSHLTPLMRAALENDEVGVLEHRERYGRMIVTGLYLSYSNIRITLSPVLPNQHITALMIAAQRGHVKCVRLLLYELGIRSPWGSTALIFAIRERRLECVRYLLPERNITNFYGRTPLMTAAEVGFPEAIKLLYPDTKMYDNFGNTALLIALLSQNRECVALLQSQIGYAGVTKLMVDAALGNVEAVRQSVAADAQQLSMLCKQTQDGWTALMFAAMYGNIECAKLLMAEVGFSTKTKQNALIIAARNQCQEILPSLLLEADDSTMTELMAYAAMGDVDKIKANLHSINKQDASGWSALMYAAAGGHIACVKALLSELTITNNSQETALMKAAQNGHAECLQPLLSLLSRRSYKGHTALMKAAQNGHFSCISPLLDELMYKDNKRRTALMHAAMGGHLEFLYMLPSDSILLEKDIDGKTARDLARERGHIRCAEYLRMLELNSSSSDSDDGINLDQPD